jgi:hypothetical protein
MEQGRVLLPDTLKDLEEGHVFEVIEIGSDLLILYNPLDWERLARIQKLIRQSIPEHRKTLESLAC